MSLISLLHDMARQSRLAARSMAASCTEAEMKIDIRRRSGLRGCQLATGARVIKRMRFII